MLLNVTRRTYRALRTVAHRSGLTNLRVGKSLADHVRNQMGHWISKVSGIGLRTPVTVHGRKMYLPDHPPLHMLLGEYEEDTTSLVESLLRPGMTFVDVGAHAGYFTLLASGLVGMTGKVYAFEPAPQNFALLKRNVELNGSQNVVLFNKAVADRTGMGELFLSSRESGWHSICPGVKGTGRTIKIELTTLDEAFAAERWPMIHLLKIDVEGAEGAVLAGMQRLLERYTSVRLIMEVNDDTLRAAGTKPGALLEELQALGFKLQALRQTPGSSQRPVGRREVFNILAARVVESRSLPLQTIK